MYRTTLVFILALFVLTGCPQQVPASYVSAPPNTVTTPVEETPTSSPTPTATPIPHPTSPDEREGFLAVLLDAIIEDPRYDPEEQVLHKYLDQVEVNVASSEINFTVTGDTDSADDMVGLAFELLHTAALAACGSYDWGMDTITVVFPAPAGSYAKFSLQPHDTISQVASGESQLATVVASEVNWGRFVPNARVRANLRTGPGTDFQIVGIVSPGDMLDIAFCAVGTDGHTWYQLTSEAWIRSDLVLNARSFVSDASALPSGETSPTAAACVIKGNVSYNTGEKIYHLPNCPDYESTIIRPDYGERWFCTEAEAQSAGWRKAWNCP